MSAPPLPPMPDAPARGAHVALGVFLAVLVGLLDSLRNSDRWPIHRVMTNYEKLRRKPLLFRMFTGLSADEFD
ncbi:MAG: hypothetical protein FJ304_07240, partial [Planctomycetes bacterium]|nr:hypothetical protein [Planctomycetota bacterium]